MTIPIIRKTMHAATVAILAALPGFSAGATQAADAAVAADQAPASTGRFDIAGFTVEGDTLLGPQFIAALLAPYTGNNRDIVAAQRARDALEAAYRMRGFGVVRVSLPEQTLRQGMVRLIVTEAKIGKVTIEGNTAFDTANIRRSMPALQEGRPPDLGRLAGSLELANENPVKKTTLQLQAAARDDEVDALVRVTDGRPWHVAATFDNSGTGNPGRSHVGLSFLHANVGGRDHVLVVQYTTSIEQPSEVGVIGATYHIPLYGRGDSIDLFGGHSNVDAGTVSAGLVNFDISGKGTAYGARYNLSLARSARYDAKLVFSVDYRIYKNDVRLFGARVGSDVTVHPVGIGYVANWTLDRTDLDLNIAASRNIPGGSHGSEEDVLRVRGTASADYTVLRYGAHVTHAFASGWQAHAGLSGLYTDDGLLPREQFGVGGAGSVRGFTEREIANDKGYAARFELYTPNLCARFASPAHAAMQCRVLAFHDSAHVSRNHALPGEPDDETIAGAGLGLRFALGRFLNAQLDVARVTKPGGLQQKGEHRMHFLLNMVY